ncbi:beta strand repeat-containing protein [Ectobacillus ponti]|uniref:Ig-like domain-containing protein n=1 Tax=Ectobacillus ponti TaxID=2961894 RepID=A0AA41X951_9BACI|nr:Ig-like domain repeat protein [Ectobacillus ponti]MCP8967666.1 hypothetical protein [Ectobacillus ponti]
MKKLGAIILAGSLMLQPVIPALAATASTTAAGTGRTALNVQTGVITPSQLLTGGTTLTGTVLIDGPNLMMSVKQGSQAVSSAIIKTFPISDKLYGYSIEVPAEGTYTLEAKTVYTNGRNAGQTHTSAVPVTVKAVTAPPVITIDPYNTKPTNQSVTVHANTNKGTLNAASHTFTDNGSFDFVAADAAGNTTRQTVTVSNIDKTAPTAEISYSTTSPVNTDVTATLQNISEDITVTNNGGLLSHTFTKNDEFTFEFEDAAGNKGTAKANVANIDKTSPVGKVSYSTTEPTNQDVTATVDFDESVTVTNNNGSASHTFTDNGDFVLEFVDKAGNPGSVTLSVNNIDKTPPTASVQYSTTEATNGDVTATIQPSENVTVTNNGSVSRTFEENGEYTFEFEDAAGNKGTAVASVKNIDKVVPTASFSYSTETLTNGDVVAQIIPSEDVTITNNNGLSAYTFGENGSFTFKFKDAAGNTGEATATVANIDKIVPTATVDYSKTTPTNEDVVATITPSEAVTVTNNGGSTSHIFTDNGSFTFEFVDKAGNKGEMTAQVNNIDKVAPTAGIHYSTTSPVNTEVTATLVDASEAITVTNTANGDFNHVFTDNDTFKFEFVDAAGNVGTATAKVNNIDKRAPIASVQYSTVDPTNQDVRVEVTFDEDNVTITNNGGSAVRTFTDNGTFTFKYKDAAGNTGEAEATVSNIDKTAPTATVEYSATTATNGDVVATIKPSEAVTVTNNGGTLSHTFTANGTFTFEFKDAAGNTGTATATVNNIDKTAPTATVTYSKTTLTNGDVTATILPSEAVTVTNNDGALAYTFTDNGTYTFTFKDAAGNTGSAVATVNNIDKKAPTATVSYSKTTPTNGDVTATITPSEAVTVTNNGGSLSHTFTANDTFTFEFKDNAGNTGTATATVNNIDKTAPTATVTYSQTAPTNGNVTATITPSEAVTVTNNSGALTYTFTANGTYTFTYVDAAGNTGNATATVNNIDKTAPTVNGVSNNQTYTSSVAPTFTEGTATLNGNPFTSGTAVSAAGSYTLVVTDAAGNTTTVQFTIVLATSITFGTFSTSNSSGGGTNLDVSAPYTVYYSSGAPKSVASTTLVTVPKPTTAGSSTSADFTTEGLTYTIKVTLTSTSPARYNVTATKK